MYYSSKNSKLHSFCATVLENITLNKCMSVLCAYCTVKVKSLAPLFCFELFISTTQDLFNSIISQNSRDQVLYLYICSKRKTLEYEMH